MKYVADTTGGKSISAYIVLNKKGDYVAKVTAFYSNGGTCLVNVFSDLDGFQYATARGGGYDKFTSALAGMQIDGIRLFDHCGRTEGTKALQDKLPRLSLEVAQKRAANMGASLANYDSGKGHYTSVYMDSGLDRLKAFGYRVIQAI